MIRPFLGLAAAIVCFAAFGTDGRAQTTGCASRTPQGTTGDDLCWFALLSADARFVAFDSRASDLVPGDTNGLRDVFVRDMRSGVTTRVSMTHVGGQVTWDCLLDWISADGRFVMYTTRAPGIVPWDQNAVQDVFLHDRATGLTRRVSESGPGVETNHTSGLGRGTPDGRYVVFQSALPDLVPGDGNAVTDVFHKDMLTGEIRRVSVDSQGREGNDGSENGTISADGRFICFQSRASNLVFPDSNGRQDAFVHDLITGVTERVNLSWLGAQGQSEASVATLSPDGRYVLFNSFGDDLVPGRVSNGYKDAYLRDRVLGTTEWLGPNRFGATGDGWTEARAISPDGRTVCLYSTSTDLLHGDTNGAADLFVRDRIALTTERISLTAAGLQAAGGSYGGSGMTPDARFVAFTSHADNLVPRDANGEEDAFVRDRGRGATAETDVILLTCEPIFAVGKSATFRWFGAAPDGEWWLLTSAQRGGSKFAGHAFGLGPNGRIQARGTCTADGGGSFVTAPFPSWTVGRTVYVELGSRDADGRISDSNTVERTVQ